MLKKSADFDVSGPETFLLIIYNYDYNVLHLWFYAATQQQRQYSRRCHCFVLSAIIRYYVEALGACDVYLNQLPPTSFCICHFVSVYYFHCSCDIHLGQY